jgi:hypothetical protein
MVIEAVRPTVDEALSAPEEEAAPRNEARGEREAAAKAPGGWRRAAAINVWLVAGLGLWAVLDALIYWTLDGVLYTMPFMVMFGMFAYRLAKQESARESALHYSGLMSLFVGGLCAISLVASVVSSPIDVACALWSGGMVAGFGYAAWYQLRSPDTTEIRGRG